MRSPFLMTIALLGTIMSPTVKSAFVPLVPSPSSSAFEEELNFHAENNYKDPYGNNVPYKGYCDVEHRYCKTLNTDFSCRPAVSDLWYHYIGDFEGLMKIRKTYRVNDFTIAQEGRSYCIFPKHIKSANSSLKDWSTFKAMKELWEENLDIGTHINPEDYSKMNSVPNKPTISDFQPEVMCNDKDKAYLNRAAEFAEQPDPSCKNPYKVEVTEIYANGLRLHNWLHIRVYAEKISQPAGATKCPTGKIKHLLLEVRDQGGLPVGEFTDQVPCPQDPDETLECPSDTTCKKVVGKRENTMPCMFTPYRAIMLNIIVFRGNPNEYRFNFQHPWLFVMSFSSDGSAEVPGGGGAPPPPGPSGPPGPPGSTPVSVGVGGGGGPTSVDYFTEAHINWKFAQHTSSVVTELHFSALVVESTTKIKFFSGRRDKFSPEFRCGPFFKNTPFLRGQVDNHEHCYPSSHYTCYSFDTHRNERLSCHLITPNANDSIVSLCKFWHIPTNQDEPKDNWFGCPTVHSENKRMYGYTAQYTILFPTLKTLGAPDYFNKKYINSEDINCKVPIKDDTFYGEGHKWKGIVPKRQNALKPNALDRKIKYSAPEDSRPNAVLKASGKILTDEGFVLGGAAGQTAFTKIVNELEKSDTGYEYTSLYDDITTADNFDQQATTYFGTKHTREAYGQDYDKLKPKMENEFKTFQTLQQQAAKERCPCPKIPTTVPPELATRPPNELDGRRYHGIQMLIAWVILVPISIFSSRYYKETFSKVFFLQEFWWYTIHVLSLFTALIFMLGGIYSLEIKITERGVWVNATWIHVLLGSATMILFTIHLCVGAIRSYNVNTRVLQILFHWIFGWIEYLIASATILSSSAIPQGFMSCAAIYVYYGFLAFQFLFYIGMEVHMRYVDSLLHLNPPRSYLPPPMMRLFHKNAPFSVFRMYMLLLYTTVCLGVYGAMHVMMALHGNEASCYQKVKTKEVVIEI